jgi:signal transduction histidine kinase/ligand-binding sensor domain-containing protein/DNA-binding response OmpR family regulator
VKEIAPKKNTFLCMSVSAIAKRWCQFFCIFLGLGVTSARMIREIPLDAYQYHISHLTVSNGLSQGSAHKILKDSRGFLWFGTQEGLNRYDGRGFRIFRHHDSDSSMLRGSHILGMVEGANGDLWIGTEECLNHYRREKDLFEYHYLLDRKQNEIRSRNFPIDADTATVWYFNDQKGLVAFRFNDRRETVLNDTLHVHMSQYSYQIGQRDIWGRFWIQGEQGVICFDPAKQSTRRFFTGQAGDVWREPLKVFSFTFDHHGQMWLGSDRGLFRFDTLKLRGFHVPFEGGAHSPVISIAIDRAEQLWMATERDGLIIYRQREKTYSRLKHDPQRDNSLLSNEISAVYVDDEDIVWANADPLGIEKITPNRKPFREYRYREGDSSGLSGHGVRCFAEDTQGRIWVGTQDAGINIFDPRSGVFTYLRHNPGEERTLPGDKIRSLLRDHEGAMWVGTSAGLCRHDARSGSFTRVRLGNPTDAPLDANFINALVQTNDSAIFVATEFGLFQVDPYTLANRQVSCIQERNLRTLHLDAYGRFFIGNFLGGFSHYEFDKDGLLERCEQSLMGYNVNCIVEDTDEKCLWIGTNKGLFKKCLDGETLLRYTIDDGLASDYIYGILIDEKGNLWLSSNRGIAKFDPGRRFFFNYKKEDGLQDFEYNTNAYFADSKGYFYFGGVRGFNRFYPSEIKDGKLRDFPLYITELQVNNRPYREKGFIGELKHICLRHNENNLLLEFVALDYHSDGHNHYKYFLEGHDRDTVFADHHAWVRYSKLSPGRYTFNLWAANEDEEWSERGLQLSILIQRPFWTRWWACLIYIFSVGVISLFVVRFLRQRRRATAEAQRLREIDALKNQFLTNLTHELRTPLTLILGPVNRALREGISLGGAELRRLQQYGDRLLHYINQLLDLRKIQEGVLPLHLGRSDVIELIEDIVDSFQPKAQLEQVELNFLPHIDHLLMDVDRDKLTQVLCNLLSNALKFTAPGGKVGVEAVREKEVLLIQVRDTGSGIARRDLPHIFERFYRGESIGVSGAQPSGTGIGLALVREFVTAMGGSVSVKSEFGAGATFFVRLPVRQTAPLLPDNGAHSPARPSAAPPVPGPALPAGNLPAESPHVLIIEDETAVAEFVGVGLAQQYRLSFAANGRQGLELAQEKLPDVVICDLMLPDISGYDICRRLKADARTGHIPIILLTAKIDKESKIKGLDCGADAYLSKPYNDTELRVRIKKLLELRRQLRHYYAESKLETTAADEHPFLAELRRLVEQWLANPDFSVPELCRHLGMSQTQLHRKLKSLTGQSAVQFIKDIRLRNARKLLEETEFNIAEIAYQVGYSDPSYFGRVFTQIVGMTPTAYREKRFQNTC